MAAWECAAPGRGHARARHGLCVACGWRAAARRRGPPAHVASQLRAWLGEPAGWQAPHPACPHRVPHPGPHPGPRPWPPAPNLHAHVPQQPRHDSGMLGRVGGQRLPAGGVGGASIRLNPGRGPASCGARGGRVPRAARSTCGWPAARRARQHPPAAAPRTHPGQRRPRDTSASSTTSRCGGRRVSSGGSTSPSSSH